MVEPILKSYGADIFCSVCHAEPFADPPTRETFDLLKIGDAWFCERHRPALAKKDRKPRTPSASPATALDAFGNLLAEQLAELCEAIDDKDESAIAALGDVEENSPVDSAS
jgi:hypothetical protein